MRENIQVIDLQFKGLPQTIGAYLIPHRNGAVLVECGPGSTIPQVTAELEKRNLSPQDISDVLLTHIHLDHAGAAGWWAQQGARVHVHQFGAPHMQNPEKLLASAKRIYQDKMDELWGEFLPVPESQIHQLGGEEILEIENLKFKVIDAPGHARHHLVYILDHIAFTGDVGGVRLPGLDAIRLPTVPPEFDPATWRKTIERLEQEDIEYIVPTHFGIHAGAAEHFKKIKIALNQIEAWMAAAFSQERTRDEIRAMFAEWMANESQTKAIPAGLLGSYEVAISTEMSADGMYRYWTKYRA